MALLRTLVSAVMLRSLHKTFRRVCWVGELPRLPEGKPVILYANHHSFYDGFLLWLLTTRLLHRPAVTWMEEWRRFPFFSAGGALPFPAGDPGRRASTIRATVRHLRSGHGNMLVYFPEGKLHPPDEGVLPFDSGALTRLSRLVPEAQWWPVGIHVTWRGDSKPTALLTGGPLHTCPDGHERERLNDTLARLRQTGVETEHPLLEGRRSPQERRGFSFLAPFFES